MFGLLVLRQVYGYFEGFEKGLTNYSLIPLEQQSAADGLLVSSLVMPCTLGILSSLQLLTKCLTASIDMLFWTFCLLTFMQCVAGLVASTLCRGFLMDDSNDLGKRKEIFLYYGTFTRSLLTMFEVLFANWSPPCRLLVDNVSEWFTVFFLFYRCVIGFAVLNVRV
eukprot:Skav230100  [mRNA]  locus=scaffold283:90303:92893:- [translate_table: standard]